MPKKSRPEMHLVLSDQHVPFQDPDVEALSLDFIKHHKPDTIHLLGDIMDFYSLSRFDKDPAKILCLQDDIDATVEYFEKLRAITDVPIIYSEGNHECFDDTTECLTADGWLHHSQLTNDTKVASFNQSSGEIEFDRPEAIHRHEFDGSLLQIKTRGVNLAVTPNHRLLTASNYDSNDQLAWRMVTASDMRLTQSRLYLKVSGRSKIPDYPVSDDELRITGWLLTDGHVDTSDRIELYQSPEMLPTILSILDRLGWTYGQTTRTKDVKQICGKVLKGPTQPSTTIRIRVPHHAAARKLVPTKSELPAWLNHISDRQFEVLLESLIDGDGSRHISSSASMMLYGIKRFLDDIQAICIKHGYRANMSEYRPGTFRLDITKGTTRSIDHIGSSATWQPYKGTVWCVTTKNDTVVVRRSGRVAITGNSRLNRFLWSRAAELSNLQNMRFESLVKLDQFKIKWVTARNPYKVGKLLFTHGDLVRKWSGATARGHYEKYGCSVIHGHTHRAGSFYHSTMSGTYGAWENGCLCSLKPEYMIGPDWQNAWSVVWFAGAYFHVEQVIVAKKQYVYHGSLVKIA